MRRYCMGLEKPRKTRFFAREKHNLDTSQPPFQTFCLKFALYYSSNYKNTTTI